MGQNKCKYCKKNTYDSDSPSEVKKRIINQILLSKLWYIWQIYTIPKYIKKEIQKRIYNFLWDGKNIRPPRHLAQLPIWKGRLGILDIDTQLDSKIISSYPCPMEGSYVALIELNFKF